MKLKYLFLLTIGLLIGLNGYSQKLRTCATPPGISEWLQAYQQNPGLYDNRSSETLYLPLTIHLVGDDNGEGYFSLLQLINAFCKLQNDFAPSNIQFFIAGDILYINNSIYYEHDFSQGQLMMSENNVDNTINCYFVASPAGACGYFGSAEDGIAIAKTCARDINSTWAHEIGHYLSLPHTFSGWEGIDYDPSEATPEMIGFNVVEKLDGSNCTNAGDGFCDTPPDYLSYRWLCNNDGESDQIQEDPNGETFRSDGTIFMSYGFDACNNRFSEDQIAAMRANINGPRSYLLSSDVSSLMLIGDTTPELTSPINNELIDAVSSFELSWEPVANADGYFVDLDVILPDSNIFNIDFFETETNNVSVSDIVSNRLYRWRVRAYSLEDGCTQFSEFQTFEAGTILSSTNELPGLSNFNAFPVPQLAGQQLKLEWSMTNSSDMQYRLLTMTGQTVKSASFFSPTGNNRLDIDTQGLTPGVYVLVLENELGRSHKRIVLR